MDGESEISSVPSLGIDSMRLCCLNNGVNENGITKLLEYITSIHHSYLRDGEKTIDYNGGGCYIGYVEEIHENLWKMKFLSPSFDYLFINQPLDESHERIQIP
jgi:hypothetical protein